MKIWKMAFAAAFALLMFAALPTTASAADWGYWHPVPVAAPVMPVERPALLPVNYNYGYYHRGSACRNWWFRVHHRRLCG